VQQESEALDLRDALDVLRRRGLLVVLCALVVAGAAFGFSKRQHEKFTTTASLVFSNNPLSQQIAGLSPGNGTNLLAQQASNVELVKLGDMASKTASTLGQGMTAEDVAGSLSISGQGESSVVNVSATATSPAIAAAIANTYTSQFVKEQQSTNHQYFASALALVNKQLGELPYKQRFGPSAVALQNRAQTLRLLDELQYGNVRIAQAALVPTAPSSPKTSRNTLVGGLVGLLLGLGLALLLEHLARDRRITEPEDLETIYGLPLIGVIPYSRALSSADSRRRRRTLSPTETEAFNLLRARLRFFNVDRNLRAVLITSAAPGDGKTTIALHLAKAAAAVGSRVLLLEADLRRPTLARRLEIAPAPGLADVLSGVVSMGDATRSVVVESEQDPGSTTRTLDVLTAGGQASANPNELIESHSMTAVLEQAKSIYDLVVVDISSLTAVSDGFPLLADVDGVLVVGRVGQSRRDASELLRRTLAGSGAPQIGVVANGVRTSVRKDGIYGYSGVRTSFLATTSVGDGPSVDPRVPAIDV
jgi:capsular exopolysaccharide synthesis family protein